MRILILATDIYARGGIARYTSTLATALARLLGAGNVDVLPLLADAEYRPEPAEYRTFRATTSRLTLLQKVRHLIRALTVARSRYDLVICSHLSQAPIAALIRLRYGAPYFVVAHGSEAWPRLPLLKRIAIQLARRVLAASAYTARVVCGANGLDGSRVSLLYNAIPEDLVRALVSPTLVSPESDRGVTCHPERSEANGGPLLLSVGSLNAEHAYKGVDTVIAALPQILEAVPRVRYLVIGSGDDRARLQQLAATLGVRERVTFLGEVSDGELVECYRVCDIFVLPSRASTSGNPRSSKGEGFGRVYVEASLAAKPVIGSRDAGAAEAVLDGRTGLLVDPRSAQEVAQAVIRLLSAPDWAAELGARGQRWALEKFTIATMQSELESILQATAAEIGQTAVWAQHPHESAY